MVLLREIRGQHDDVARRRWHWAAERQTADLLRRGQVSLQQRRRELTYTHVVEAMAHIVFWEKRGHIDLERQKVADRILVFGSIEPVERLGSARIGVGRGRPVERRLQIRHHRVVRGVVRPRAPGRRHHAATKFPHDFFPCLGLLAHALQVDRRKREPSRFGSVVVAADAILIDDRPL